MLMSHRHKHEIGRELNQNRHFLTDLFLFLSPTKRKFVTLNHINNFT